MRSNLTRAALLFVTCALCLTGCTKTYPECVGVAAAVGRIAISEAAKRYGADSEEMKSVEKQVAAQQEKVTKECNAKVSKDESVWLPWAECMATASTAEEAMKCKNAGQ